MTELPVRPSYAAGRTGTDVGDLMDPRLRALLDRARDLLGTERLEQLHYLALHDPPLCVMELVELNGAGRLSLGARELAELRALL